MTREIFPPTIHGGTGLVGLLESLWSLAPCHVSRMILSTNRVPSPLQGSRGWNAWGTNLAGVWGFLYLAVYSQRDLCYDLHFAFPQNSYVEILITRMELGGGGFGM
jgi:hypothetical protein